MPKFNGTLMHLYVAEVTDIDTDPQGDGDTYVPDTTDYTKLGLSKDLSIDRGRDEIDAADKDSGLDPDAVGGRRSGGISATVNFDDEEDDGQVIVETAYESERGEIWFLATQDKPDKKEYWGRAIVTDAGLSFPQETIAEMNFSASAAGAIHSGTAASAA